MILAVKKSVMPRIFLPVLLFFTSYLATGQAFQGNRTATYDEAIAAYRALAAQSTEAELIEAGTTDSGRPLHLFVIDRTRVTAPKSTLFINNGIHPGEPCGVDASIQLAERLIDPDHVLHALLDSVKVVIVPMYNVGGALRRGCCVRANQDGPEEYGFRGNARNLDLNRDFIKADALNTFGFYRAFHLSNPEVVIDTHTSNGADYSYVMTMLNTQPDKAGRVIGDYMREKMNPMLYDAMEVAEYELIPYVMLRKQTPDEGIFDYLETPRYTTGYSALFNAIGYTTETHMLKPFADRVESTYRFLVSVLGYMYTYNSELLAVKREAEQVLQAQTVLPVNWSLDTTQFRMIPFKGYEAEYPTSEVTGEKRLFYNRARPYIKEIRYYDTYAATDSVTVPHAYIVPQAWREVIDRFEANGVEMERLERDTVMRLECYYIRDFQSSGRPYEGHHMKTVKELETVVEEVQLFAGDCIIHPNQKAKRYIVETLEPKAVDSFFRWGFFDSVLQQKEWYSDYVFEDRAAELLASDEALRKEFLAKKASDADFAASPDAQLYWIYRRSPHYEGTVNRYPVYRIPAKP